MEITTPYFNALTMLQNFSAILSHCLGADTISPLHQRWIDHMLYHWLTYRSCSESDPFFQPDADNNIGDKNGSKKGHNNDNHAQWHLKERE